MEKLRITILTEQAGYKECEISEMFSCAEEDDIEVDATYDNKEKFLKDFIKLIEIYSGRYYRLYSADGSTLVTGILYEYDIEVIQQLLK